MRHPQRCRSSAPTSNPGPRVHRRRQSSKQSPTACGTRGLHRSSSRSDQNRCCLTASWAWCSSSRFNAWQSSLSKSPCRSSPRGKSPQGKTDSRARALRSPLQEHRVHYHHARARCEPQRFEAHARVCISIEEHRSRKGKPTVARFQYTDPNRASTDRSHFKKSHEPPPRGRAAYTPTPHNRP